MSLDDIAARQAATLRTWNQPGRQGFVEGFFSSVVSSVPEFFGAQPTAEAAEFRAENPVAGIVSQLIAPTGIYGGAFKASRAIPVLKRSTDWAYKVAGGLSRPLVAGAAREVVRFTPIEAIRLATGAALSDDYPKHVGDVLLDLGIAGGAGAFVSAVRAAGKMPRIGARITPPPSVDLRLRPTFQYRQGLVSAEKEPARWELWKQSTRDLVFSESVAHKTSDKVLMDFGGREDKEFPGKLFGSSLVGIMRAKGAGFKAKRFKIGSGGFESEEELAEAMRRAQVSPEDASWLVTPRLVQANTVEGARRLGGTITKQMREIEPGLFLAKEKDGLFIVARKVTGEVPRVMRGGKASGELRVVPTTSADKLKHVDAAWKKNQRERGIELPYTAREAVERLAKLERQIEELKNRIASGVAAGKKPLGVNDMALRAQELARLEKSYNSLWRYTTPLRRMLDEAPQTKTIRVPMPRKIETAGRAAAKAGDEWLIYQTDDLEKVSPAAANYRNMFINEMSKMRRGWDRSFDPASTTSGTRALAEELRRALALGAQDPEVLRKSLGGIVGRVLGRNMPQESRLYRGMVDKIFNLLKPSTFQESRNPLFSYAIRLLRGISENQESLASQVVFGSWELRPGTSAFAAALGKGFDPQPFREGLPSAMQVLKTLTKEQFNKAVSAAYRGLKVEELADAVARGDIDEATRDAMLKLHQLDQYIVQELRETLRSVGFTDFQIDRVFKPLQTYYLLPRKWDGDFRTVIRDKATQKEIALGSGRTVTASEENARRIIEELNKRGITAEIVRTTRAREAFLEQVQKGLEDLFDPSNLLSGPYAENVREAVASVMRLPPKRFLERKEIPGEPDFRAQWGEFDVDDYIKTIYSTLDRKLKYVGYKVWEHIAGEDVAALRAADSVAFRELMRRADDIIGVQGPFNQGVNDFADKMLAPVLGANSASKIAAAANSIMYWFQLGFANPTFAILNAVTPIQTVTPWLSFVQTAPREAVASLMGWLPVVGKQGALGQIGYVHPMKLMARGFRLMGKPDEELRKVLGRAVSERVLTSQITSELIGVHAAVPQQIREALRSGDFLKAVGQAIRWLPEKSESFARTFAFVTNYELGRTVLGLKDEALFQFAKRSTELTMVNYATVDRARIITGPVGSMFGLFKNWTMHYMGMLGRYAQVGIDQNNWGPLLWAVGSSIGAAGLGGTPIGLIINGLANAYQQTGWEFLREQFNSDRATDAVWYGLPGLFGVSVQSSAAMPGADINRDISMFFSSVHLDRARALGNALSNGWEHWKNTGESPMADPNIRDQVVRAVAPRAFFRAASVAEGDFIKSMTTGYPLQRDVSAWERWLYGMGFNPTNVERNFEIADKLFRDERKMTEAVRRFGQAYATATARGDYERASVLLTQAVLQGIPIDRMMASAQSRLRREEETMFHRFRRQTLAETGRMDLLFSE